MDLFPLFARTVHDSFVRVLERGPSAVFVADIDGSVLWDKYLAAFPPGTDPLFKKRTEHDCSCCKGFVRRAGAVVAIKDGQLRTIWDEAAESAPGPYAVVAAAMRNAVREVGIRDLFRVGAKETQFGAAQTYSLDVEGGDNAGALTWNHFYTGEIPRTFRVAEPDTVRGEYRTTVQVFERGLNELTPDALETTLSLIEGGGGAEPLYRGQEHKRAVTEFRKLQRAYLELGTPERALFTWLEASSPFARFRNTVIGTLVQELSEGKDIEEAVKAFETKVAPQNYKRTTAVITPMMVKKAMATIEELGLESALERRFAVIGDVSVNDVKWVDGSTRGLMKGGLGELLMKHAVAATSAGTSAKDQERAEDIAIDAFVARVLPEAQSLELFFAGRHTGNLMALTAPVHPEPKQLFRWTNDFAWSYGGNVADSIKERVKKAGGRIEGALRVSLSWFNFDDLDLHVAQPPGRGIHGAMPNEISFRNTRGWTGGTLDVDMNAGSGYSREAVENVVWATTPPDGPYRIIVNNFCLRESRDPGFVIETECGGEIAHYSYNKQVRDGQNITVATLHMKGGHIERVDPGDAGITSASISQDKWGLKTEQYVKVSTVMLSPNYWGDNAVGNKHTFFVLEGAKSDEDMRGFYNEFLHPRLEPHRKVFEIIGDKTKCQPTEGHLAGLGFSSTKKDSFLVRVQQGKKQRIFNVLVGG